MILEHWKLTKALQQSEKHLFKKKWLNLGNNIKLLFPPPRLFSSTLALKSNSPPSRGMPVAWQPPVEWHCSSFKASLPENCHDLTCLNVFWKMLLARLCFFDLTWSSSNMKSLFSGAVVGNI